MGQSDNNESQYEGKLPSLSLPIEEVSKMREPKVVKAITHVHEALVDAVLMNPAVSKEDLSELTGKSKQWVSYALQSPLVKNLIESRRCEILNPVITASIEERLNAVAAEAIDLLHSKILMGKVSDSLLIKAVELSTRHMNVGNVKTEEKAVESNHLESLASRLVALKSKTNSEVIYEGRIKEVQDGTVTETSK
jgi:hypothetical protein